MKYDRDDYRQTVRDVSTDARWTVGHVFTRVILPIIALVVVLSIIGGILGWFGEAADVAREEFGPSAMRDKYQWFVQQAHSIESMDSTISVFESRVKGVDRQYSGYGEDMSKWPPHIQVQYNNARQQTRDDLVAVVTQRNGLVREYNAASNDFFWENFKHEPDLPPKLYTKYVVPPEL